MDEDRGWLKGPYFYGPGPYPYNILRPTAQRYRALKSAGLNNYPLRYAVQTLVERARKKGESLNFRALAPELFRIAFDQIDTVSLMRDTVTWFEPDHFEELLRRAAEHAEEYVTYKRNGGLVLPPPYDRD